MSVLQLIDENKEFSPETTHFLSTQHVLSAGLNYHLVAVFGSQSTGKSTLLNALFSTEFGTMDQMTRQQTTKGIWMGVDRGNPDGVGAKSGSGASDGAVSAIKAVTDAASDVLGGSHEATGSAKSSAAGSPILVLDVEGTDGRERGEDQDFERKSALFALASSEVLIVNMWEHQVGLYQGANMGLLKTVFEVNLGLFQASGQTPRSRILFVIRDHVGTPLENLSNTLLTDLNKHWETISKPSHLADSKLSDFFDIDFIALPHKVLQPDLFKEKVADLRRQFPKYFNKEYHRNIPIDGWPHYAEQIWQQIELNKDLDLPTQQILVARFRCQEIADQAWGTFTSHLASSNEKFGGSQVIGNFGQILGPLRVAALEAFDSQASKYNANVYQTERKELVQRLDTLLMAHYKAQLDAASVAAVALYQTHLSTALKQGKPFAAASKEAHTAAHAQFTQVAKESALDAETYAYDEDLKGFEASLDQEMAKQRDIQMAKINQRISKKIAAELSDTVPAAFRPPTHQSWTKALSALNDSVDSALKPHANGEDFGLGGTAEESKKSRNNVLFTAWKQFDVQIADLTRADGLAQRLRDAFDDNFQYDENGTPILWKQGDDIEGAYKKARTEALDLLPIFVSAKLEDGTYIEPPASLAELYTRDDYEAPNYRRLVSEARQEQVRSRFLKDANTAFLNAKRSVSVTAMHVPVWIWAVIILLGWNEFMMVLRNPLLVLLVLILSGGGFALHTMGLSEHALSVAGATLRQVEVVAKEKLREYVNEPVAVSSESKRSSTLESEAPSARVEQDKASAPGAPGDIELEDL